MNLYPYDYPLILTSDIYLQYGGQTGTMTDAQLNSAFLTAETRVSKYIGTFLLPTVITGTYTYKGSRFIATDYGYVNQILSASLLTYDGNTRCNLTSKEGCAIIRDDTYGYIDYINTQSACGCLTSITPAYQFQIAYEAGLPTGTANHPNVLHALTIIAEEAINEMQYPRAGEAVGNRAVMEWGDQDYREIRKDWKRTVLGVSARAAYAAELLDAVIKKARKAVMLR